VLGLVRDGVALAFKPARGDAAGARGATELAGAAPRVTARGLAVTGEAVNRIRSSA
jgi:hypothetical protein